MTHVCATYQDLEGGRFKRPRLGRHWHDIYERRGHVSVCICVCVYVRVCVCGAGWALKASCSCICSMHAGRPARLNGVPARMIRPRC